MPKVEMGLARDETTTEKAETIWCTANDVP